mgnify:CR=1 FL=1
MVDERGEIAPLRDGMPQDGCRPPCTDILEAARGMGSTAAQILWRIKLPLAMPVILSGFKNMVVMTIAWRVLLPLSVLAVWVSPFTAVSQPII